MVETPTTSTSKTNTVAKKNGVASTVGLICGAAVYFIGNALFPATSSYASDRGPRMITMMLVAGAVAGIVTLVISLLNSKRT